MEEIKRDETHQSELPKCDRFHPQLFQLLRNQDSKWSPRVIEVENNEYVKKKILQERWENYPTVDVQEAQ